MTIVSILRSTYGACVRAEWTNEAVNDSCLARCHATRVTVADGTLQRHWEGRYRWHRGRGGEMTRGQKRSNYFFRVRVNFSASYQALYNSTISWYSRSLVHPMSCTADSQLAFRSLLSMPWDITKAHAMLTRSEENQWFMVMIITIKSKTKSFSNVLYSLQVMDWSLCLNSLVTK